jgi:hypothetical protein
MINPHWIRSSVAVTKNHFHELVHITIQVKMCIYKQAICNTRYYSSLNVYWKKRWLNPGPPLHKPSTLSSQLLHPSSMEVNLPFHTSTGSLFKAGISKTKAHRTKKEDGYLFDFQSACHWSHFLLKSQTQVWLPLLIKFFGNLSSLLFALQLVCYGLKILGLIKMSLTFMYSHITQFKIVYFCRTAWNVAFYIHSSIQWPYMCVTVNVWKTLNCSNCQITLNLNIVAKCYQNPRHATTIRS